MPDIQCETCGGTEFYKEAGYFFCQGCQVQSQEVQEYAFDEFTADTRRTTRKLGKEKKENTEDKITSWECYNYILLGLTDELINLGATKKLKIVVKILWLRYLEKVEVFRRGVDTLPKLQGVYSDMDADIVYGRAAKRKKRRKSSSSEKESTTLNSSSVTQERIKRKRALIKAQYEEFSQKSQATSSVHNESLATLNSSDKSTVKSQRIAYNIYACKELGKMKTTKKHRHRHWEDTDRTLKCHRMTYRTVSRKYRNGPYILSLNKIYAILYLGLLIVKDKIQLGDMLRFIKEGHLSFNCYDHFFPEDFSDKKINFTNFKRHSVFAGPAFRSVVSEIATFLKVEHYIDRPNLVELCERYIKELNLPVQVFHCARNIISKSDIKVKFHKRFNKVPNYEARALSIIIFVMKLLFGLDDVTEFELGKYAQILKGQEVQFFNIVEWLEFIEYRNLVMIDASFSANYQTDCRNIRNVALSLATIRKKDLSTTKYNVNKDRYKQFLSKLEDYSDKQHFTESPVTFTPFFDYTKLIPKHVYLELIYRDFTNTSIVHILQPTPFLELLGENRDLEMVHGGGNNDWILEKVTCLDIENKKNLYEKRAFTTVKLCLSPEIEKDPESKELKPDPEELKITFHKNNTASFAKNKRRLKSRQMSEPPFKLDYSLEEGDYCRHFLPYERFWLRTKLRLENQNQNACRNFISTFPNNFRILLKECQRIAQQSEQEFFVEYQFTELCLVYLSSFGKDEAPCVINNKTINHYLKTHSALW